MPNDKHSRPSDQFSDSDRTALEELRSERQRARTIAEYEAARKVSRMERVKAWALFIGVAAGFKGLLWEPLKAGLEWLAAHFR